MEMFIIKILSSVFEASFVLYFILSLLKILNKEKIQYSKKQIIFLNFISAILIFCGYFIKKFSPFINWCFILPIVLILLIYYIKAKPLTAIIAIALNMIGLIISELLSAGMCMSLFNIDSEILVNSPKYLLISLIIQYSLFFLIIELINISFKNKDIFTNMIQNISLKYVLRLLIILVISILPQTVIYVLNKYNYPTYFLILNSLQMILVCIVIFFAFKNTMEKEKFENDLQTEKLHNQTMVGMVDGVRTLKHDYNNIIQALNGYVATKQYDKLQEHINKVLDECNIVNNLSIIDPKIFNDPAIYGIVGAKFFLATEKDIKFEMDIITDISKIDFSKPDLSRILGILLDNAMEATLKADRKYIKLEMKYDNRKCADVIRIYNTYDNNITINLNDIYKKGVSSKKVKSGIGLWEVKKLVNKSRNSQIFASIEKDKFVQNLIIEKR